MQLKAQKNNGLAIIIDEVVNSSVNLVAFFRSQPNISFLAYKQSLTQRFPLLHFNSNLICIIKSYPVQLLIEQKEKKYCLSSRYSYSLIIQIHATNQKFILKNCMKLRIKFSST